MDKGKNSDLNLAKIMSLCMAEIQNLVQKYPSAKSRLKSDGTFVTDLDLALSQLVEFHTLAHFSGANFYSEENYSGWRFPSIIVDPLDGTREYMAGRSEWSISVAYFEDENFRGEGWVYNPITHEIFQHRDSQISFIQKDIYHGEVSRSEWENGLFDSKYEGLEIRPMGSIAYKLGRLSRGEVDFVVSLRPKNIWDVAGGTLLARQAGFKFYSEGREVTKVLPQYRPPLIWCHEKLFSKLSNSFLQNHKRH